MFRLFGMGVILFWIGSMGWLVWHDIWPNLTAGDPPRTLAFAADSHDQVQYQVGLFDKYGHRIGTAWSIYSPGSTVRRQDSIELTSASMLEPLFIEVDFEYTPDAVLDEFRLQVWMDSLPSPREAALAPLEVKGLRFASVYGFSVRLGRITESFKIGAADMGLVGDVFRPFGRLVGLHIGQTWRMQVVNPVAAFAGFGNRFNTVLVRVTGQERIPNYDGKLVECFVVETENAKAWVEESGRVVRQEVHVPMQGRITLSDEPFNEVMLKAARANRPNA
jgi:hypothetical protein